MKTQSIIRGTKYFRFEADQDEPEIIRARSFDSEKNIIKYFDKDGNKKSMTLDDLKSRYKMLRPDGILNVIIANSGELSDVITTIVSYDDRSADLPFAVCRQCIYDIFTNMTERLNKTVLGLSINKNNCPTNINFKDIFACSGVKDVASIMVYLDDSLDDILSFLNVKKYDAVLRNTAESVKMGYRVMPDSGLCNTYRELLEINNFMYDFRQCFKIEDLPFNIEQVSENDENELVVPSELDFRNTIYLEGIIRKNIMATYVIKYTREIDLKTIKREYILAASSAEQYRNIYIVGYDASDNEYIDRAQIQQ